MIDATTTTAINPKRIVVLGGLGFIGSHLCRALVSGGNEVRIFDKLYASRKLIRDIEHRVEIVEGDISRAEDVLNCLRDAEVVVHLVHTTVPGSSMDDPAHDVLSNVVAAIGWLRRLQETPVRRLLYVSSGGGVYGVPQAPLIDETHPTNPISSYGITKLAIEKYVSMYASMYGITCHVLRPSNVYGEGQRLNIAQGVVGVLADRALRGETLEVWGTGETSRDYLHYEDLVAAMLKILKYDGAHSIFNVSSGVGHSVRDVIEILSEQLGDRPQVIHTPSRGFDVPVNVLDSTRLAAAVDWRPRIGLQEGVARTLKWLRGLHAE